MYNTVTVFHNGKYGCFHKTVTENELCSLSRLFTRTGKNLPLVSIMLIKKQELNNSTCSDLDTVHTGRKNSCIVKNETIARIQIVKNIIKMLMLNFTACFIKNKQT